MRLIANNSKMFLKIQKSKLRINYILINYPMKARNMDDTAKAIGIALIAMVGMATAYLVYVVRTP